MKTQRETEIMLKTFVTKRNNMLKRLYLPPYEYEKENYLKQLERLEIQIKMLEWVLGVGKENRPELSRKPRTFLNQLKYMFRIKL